MLSRREFVKLCMGATLSMSLAQSLEPLLGEVLALGPGAKPPVIWLELGSCTGNTISLDNTMDPGMDRFLKEMIDLRFHAVFQASQGREAVQALRETWEKWAGKYLLVVEGAPQTAREGRFSYLPGLDGSLRTGLQVLQELAAQAKWVVAVGSCAAWGGPAAAYPNPTGAKGVWEVLGRRVINIPGCPANPDWMVGILAHLILYGEPELDAYNRPVMFFGKTIHDQCQRRQFFDNGIFAQFPGEAGCLYKVGCKGPVTYADCPNRMWNNHVNWPVKASTPCIGCTNPEFPDGMEPFFQHLPNLKLPGVTAGPDAFAKVAGTLTALGIGGHLAASVVTGRLGKHWLEGTKAKEDDPAGKPDKTDLLLRRLEEIVRLQGEMAARLQELPPLKDLSGGGSGPKLATGPKLAGKRKQATGPVEKDIRAQPANAAGRARPEQVAQPKQAAAPASGSGKGRRPQRSFWQGLRNKLFRDRN